MRRPGRWLDCHRGPHLREVLQAVLHRRRRKDARVRQVQQRRRLHNRPAGSCRRGGAGHGRRPPHIEPAQAGRWIERHASNHLQAGLRHGSTVKRQPIPGGASGRPEDHRRDAVPCLEGPRWKAWPDAFSRTTQQAHACKAERQLVAPAQTCCGVADLTLRWAEPTKALL